MNILLNAIRKRCVKIAYHFSVRVVSGVGGGSVLVVDASGGGPDRLSVRVVSGVGGGSVVVVDIDAGGGVQTVCQLEWCLV